LVATVDKVSRLWLRPMDSETMTPLAGTEGARFPFWSPDGRSIGFFAHAKLKAVDVISGAVEVLAYAPDPHGGTWNRDDVILFVPRAGPDSSEYRRGTGGPLPSSLLRTAIADSAISPCSSTGGQFHSRDHGTSSRSPPESTRWMRLSIVH
jgi:hypothetical protein